MNWIKHGLNPELEAIAMDSSKHRNQRKTFKLSWHFYAVCFLVAVVAVAVSFHFSRIEEYAYEMADLEVMRNAEDTAILLWRDKLPDTPVGFWYLPGELRLIPDTEPMPIRCGMGTGKAGGAVSDFEAKAGKNYGYSEHEDYRDKALHVTVSKSDDDLDIRVNWVVVE